MLKGNAIVGQSGGPTSVINASLAGVIDAVRRSVQIDRLYGMNYGIDGVLNDNVTDLSAVFETDEQIEILRSTPAAYLGSCRNRLPKDDDTVYERIFSVLNKYNIAYFFYIGGNDSMDTVLKLSHYAEKKGYPIRIVGVPKTIDNDLAVTDHTPGYGSAAKFIATAVREVVCDATVYDVNSTTIIEIMGRNAGWLTAAAALARSEGQCAPHLIYLPEVAFDKERFLGDMVRVNKVHKNVVVAVSEGIKDADGKYICDSGVKDAFGHSQLSGAAAELASLVRGRLGWKARSMELNLLQRCSAHMASKTDNCEAYNSAYAAVQAALEGKTGCMMCFERKSNSPYEIEIKAADIKHIANAEKTVPVEWITPEGNDVTAECTDYIRPLIQGEAPVRYKDGIPVYFER